MYAIRSYYEFNNNLASYKSFLDENNWDKVLKVLV